MDNRFRAPCEGPGEGSHCLIGEEGADVRHSLVRWAETEAEVREMKNHTNESWNMS